VVGQQNADPADTLQLRDIAMATIFVFLNMGRTLPPANTTEPSVCSGDVSLYQITLTTWLYILVSSNESHIFSVMYESSLKSLN